jgi:ABC-type uncharacterized transport system ATPase subunit
VVAAQPTRGLKVGPIEFVHKQLVGAMDNSAAFLLVSAELDDILSLSDRVALMFVGKIGRLMAGLHS